MNLYYAESGVTLYHGNCLDVLNAMPDETVQCCVTSPPYFGLRDYGVEGQLGLEPTPDAYVQSMVAVFREVRRVLKKDGTCWLNLGDSYANTNMGHNSNGFGGLNGTNKKNKDGFKPNRFINIPEGLKPKDLIGIPWMVAFALRADGWYLRSDIIWAKPNPMPESVKDRPTKSHEYLFLLSKSERYYYDAEAIKEPAIYGDPRKPYAPGQVDTRGNGHARGGGAIRPSVAKGGFYGKTEAMADTGQNAFRSIKDFRNKRSVWTIATQPYPEAHFATFPQKLIEPCILAGSRVGDVVLDPFSGSGTTAFVAKRLARQAVGIELKDDYLVMSIKRLSQEILPL